LPGCGGCRDNQGLDREAAAKARAKAEAEKRARDKLPFEIARFRIQPNDLDPDRVEIPLVKPGHWTGSTLTALANQGDFSGQMQTEPLPLADAPFRLSSLRPIALSKGQTKTIEQLFFVPNGFSARQFYTTLETARGSEVSKDVHGIAAMPAHQYFLVVISREPDRYRYVRGLDFVQAPSGTYDSAARDPHYRVVFPHVKTRTPLANNPLAWSAIAAFLWDDQDPTTFTLAQQAALVDWLHWGGQLIVSGPDSLTRLTGTFLGPYLPAQGGAQLQLDADALSALADATRPTSQNKRQLSAPQGTWPAEELRLQPGAEVMVATQSGVPLVAERRVGNGRVVATAFRLTQRELIGWDGCDAFYHGVLLRRPGRQFLALDGELTIAWNDRRVFRDPARVTNVRYFSRDAAVSSLPTTASAAAADQLPGPSAAEPQYAADGSEIEVIGPSTAGWSSLSAVGQLAQRAGRDATRIEIPNSSFVIRMLALYLAVLVPINWLVFRAVGRVEWAWIAAPIIAVVGAAVVVRAAQLDIGFVRASHELATLELFADHPRGHLTRYTSLYTSLSTEYDLVFDNPTALAQPFPSGAEQLRGQARADVELERAEKVTLHGLPVLSNSVGVVHSEQMFDLEGSLRLESDRQRPGAWQIFNGTRLDLQGVGVLQPQGAAWVGELPAGATAPLEFELALAGAAWQGQRNASPETAAEATPGVTHLRALVEFAENQRAPGEWRLVAWTRQELAGLSIEPRAAQQRSATVVVAHLRPGELPPRERDRASRAEVTVLLKTMNALWNRSQGEPFELQPPAPQIAPPAARPRP